MALKLLWAEDGNVGAFLRACSSSCSTRIRFPLNRVKEISRFISQTTIKCLVEICVAGAQSGAVTQILFGISSLSALLAGVFDMFLAPRLGPEQDG